MESEIINQLSSMQLEVAQHLEQTENPWKNVVWAYKKSWEAMDFYNHLTKEQQLENITYAAFFVEQIGQIATTVMENEEGFLEITREVLSQIASTKAELKTAQKNLEPLVAQFGDVAGPEVSRLLNATQNMQSLKNNAQIALDFTRIMCDLTGADNIESEGYHQYSKLYNLLAKFLDCPLRGYDKADLSSMSLDELEYVEAQISIREKTEQLDVFFISYLEMIRKQIREQISLKKKLQADDAPPLN